MYDNSKIKHWEKLFFLVPVSHKIKTTRINYRFNYFNFITKCSFVTNVFLQKAIIFKKPN